MLVQQRKCDRRSACFVVPYSLRVKVLLSSSYLYSSSRTNTRECLSFQIIRSISFVQLQQHQLQPKNPRSHSSSTDINQENCDWRATLPWTLTIHQGTEVRRKRVTRRLAGKKRSQQLPGIHTREGDPSFSKNALLLLLLLPWPPRGTSAAARSLCSNERANERANGTTGKGRERGAAKRTKKNRSVLSLLSLSLTPACACATRHRRCCCCCCSATVASVGAVPSHTQRTTDDV